jgi:3-hydroxy acid dehydrogenase / malonic semialdehyde reductase
MHIIACDAMQFYRVWWCGFAPIPFHHVSEPLISFQLILSSLFSLVSSAPYHMLPLRTARHILRPSNSLRNISLDPNPALLRTMASSAMSKRLEGKTIVITGASSGIGKSTAIEFARTAPKNLKLVLTARRADKLKELAEQIKTEFGDGVKVLPVKLDISSPEEVRGFVGALPEEFREIDVLVNNA